MNAKLSYMLQHVGGAGILLLIHIGAHFEQFYINNVQYIEWTSSEYQLHE